MALAAEVMVRIAADAERFNRVVERAERQLDNLGGTSRRVSRGAIAAFSGIVPAISPIGAAAIGAAGAIAASFAAAGVALAGFGAVAVTVLNDVFEASEDIEKINEKIEKAQALGDQEKVNKLLKERAAIMATLSTEQQRAATALADFKSFWDDFAKQFEEPVVDFFVSSLYTLQNVLKGLQPAFQVAMESLGDFFDIMSEMSNSKQAQQFFNWIAQQAGPAITAFGNIAVNVFGGFVNLLMAFTPLTNSVQNGLVGMSEAFLQWTQSLKGSESFKAFIDYVKANGSKILSILGNLAVVFGGLLVAFAPIGSVILTILQKAAQGLAYLVQIAFSHKDQISTAFQQLQTTVLPFVINLWNRIVMAFNQAKAVILPIVMSLFTTITTFIQTYGPQILTVIQTTWNIITNVISLAQQAILAVIQFAWPYINQIIQLVMTQIAPFLIQVWGRISAFINQIMPKIVQIVQWAWQNVIQPVITTVMNTLIPVIESAWNFIKGIIDGALDMIMGLINTALSILTGDWEGAWDGMQQFTSGVWEIIETLVDEGIQLVYDIIVGGLDLIKGIHNDFWEAGKNLILGLADGIAAFAGDVVDAAVAAAKDAVAAVKGWLGISSPAKLTIEMGQDFGAGFAIGIQDMTKAARKAALEIARASVQPMSFAAPESSLRPSSSATTPSITKIYQTTINNYGSDLDDQEVMNALRRKEWLDA
jgi:phage-related protein